MARSASQLLHEAAYEPNAQRKARLLADAGVLLDAEIKHQRAYEDPSGQTGTREHRLAHEATARQKLG